MKWLHLLGIPFAGIVIWHHKAIISELSEAFSLLFSAFAVPSLEDVAETITVQVVTESGSGSGILIQQKESDYTVLTNQHVVQFREQFTIHTFDGKQYAARLIEEPTFQDKDLALLHFESKNVEYPIAKLSQKPLQIGDPVFSAGFPYPTNDTPISQFRFTSGEVNLLLPLSMDGGYQVGYSNPVRKGMSGGPVLNQSGQLVAINGKHAYPLWGDTFVFTDGSRPCDSLREKMITQSWAIPIQPATDDNEITSTNGFRIQLEKTSEQSPLCHQETP